jgi:sec-independent protein translocase protein TatC
MAILKRKPDKETDDDAPGGQMTLIEHLAELRKRIIIMVIALGVCTLVMFLFYNRALHFLAGPYEQVTRGDRACGGTKNRGCDLIATGPIDPFLVRMKVSLYGGIALSVPILFWEIWRFVTPGLHKNERRYGIAFMIYGVILFVLGCIVAWFTVSKALEFLLNVGGPSIQPFITADKYLTLVMLMLAAFGIAFEFPLLVIFLLLVRVVNTRQLRSIRRWMAVGITAFAAIITPSQDPFSLLFMAIPMYIFYELAILVGRVMKR